MGYGSIFIDIDNFPESWQGWFQLVFLSGSYSYILLTGCNLISEGSELLELTKYKDLVGPTILPVLGAVPDGAIVLFSGIGSNAQEQLETGLLDIRRVSCSFGPLALIAFDAFSSVTASLQESAPWLDRRSCF